MAAWEIKGYLDANGGVLHVDGVNAAALAAEHGTPLFVFSESRIRHNIQRIRHAGSVIGKKFKICYAAKACSTMAILRSIKDAGCDIEVNSGGELWKALEIGFTPDQIIFNGTSKEAWEIEMAVDAGIYAIQADSLFELSVIDVIAAKKGKRAAVSLRLVPEIETDTHSGLQTALLTSKFGMMPEEAYTAFGQYKGSPNVDLCGIHLHVGSQNPDPNVYTQALETLFESLVNIDRMTGMRLSHVNIGGGFPVNYLRAPAPAGDAIAGTQAAMLGADFEPADAIGVAWEALEKAANAAGAAGLLDGITILTEPGRSVIADAGICLTTVRNVKTRTLETGTEENWLLTDAGFNILLSMETYKWYYHLISATRAAEQHAAPYKLAGPLCDGGDVYFDIEGLERLPEHRLLPRDVSPGEVLALLNCGAYSLAQASQYNGRFLPPVILIRNDGTPELVRRRDSFADLAAQDIY